MAYVAEMKLDGGDVVLMEVSGHDGAGVQRVGRGAALAAGASDTLQQALSRVRPALDAVVTSIRSLAEPPSPSPSSSVSSSRRRRVWWWPAVRRRPISP